MVCRYAFVLSYSFALSTLFGNTVYTRLAQVLRTLDLGILKASLVQRPKAVVGIGKAMTRWAKTNQITGKESYQKASALL